MDQFHKQVLRMQFRLKDSLDKPDHTLARQLISSLQKIEDAAQYGKSPTSINISLKQFRSLLNKAEAEEVISHGDADTIEDWVEDSLRKIR